MDWSLSSALYHINHQSLITAIANLKCILWLLLIPSLHRQCASLASPVLLSYVIGIPLHHIYCKIFCESSLRTALYWQLKQNIDNFIILVNRNLNLRLERQVSHLSVPPRWKGWKETMQELRALYNRTLLGLTRSWGRNCVLWHWAVVQ